MSIPWPQKKKCPKEIRFIHNDNTSITASEEDFNPNVGDIAIEGVNSDSDTDNKDDNDEHIDNGADGSFISRSSGLIFTSHVNTFLQRWD